MTIRTIFFLTVLLAAMTVSHAQNIIQVGQNVQVSKARPDHAHYELDIGADPNDPRHLVACSIIFLPEKNARANVLYMSKDAGKTWTKSLEVDRSNYVGDPSCVYGPNGSVYFASLLINFPSVSNPGDDGKKSEMVVYRTRDGGTTWDSPVVLPFNDREYLTVDMTGGKFNGRVYLHGTDFEPTIDSEDRINRRVRTFSLFRSVDGSSFERAANVPTTYVTTPGNGVVTSDGTFVALFREFRIPPSPTLPLGGRNVRQTQSSPADKTLKAVRSDDGGNTLSSVTVSDWWVNPGFPRGTAQPYLAVDSSRGIFHDRLYAVWPDTRSGRSEIYMSHSSDKGKTWSRPIVVNDDASRLPPAEGPDDIHPAVAVNKDGVVGVSWYDRRNIADDMGWEARFSASLDGGESFLPSVKVSEAPYSPSAGKLPLVTVANTLEMERFYLDGGDTTGTAADAAGVFHPLWIDNRTGVPQVWTAAITVQAKARRNGNAELEELDDLSKNLRLDYANLDYDPKTNIVTGGAFVENRSKENVLCPVKVKAMSVKSPFRTVEVLQSDSGGTGAGSTWTFGCSGNNTILKPGEKTQTHQLKFRLIGFDGVTPETQILVQLDPKIFGKIQPAKKP